MDTKTFSENILLKMSILPPPPKKNTQKRTRPFLIQAAASYLPGYTITTSYVSFIKNILILFEVLGPNWRQQQERKKS